ncbi:MAG: molybdenum cofactor guanylyltransferase [Deltaproteobacteria bacterium]|jgi:molybdopterin-guanine dinucleotide biosynthesis protein A|nr:molybdenum cofactor guanylyltransferase [Deltaproteobacteria bacterium]
MDDRARGDARRAKTGGLPEYGDVTGVVLAGGMGRRLGRDKTALRLPDREQDFLVRTAGILASVLSDVRVSCRDDLPERLARAGSYPILPDHYPGGGALRAVYSALRHTGRPCLILACDMPFMREDLLVALLEARRRRPATIVQTLWRSPDGTLEPLAAVYEPQALSLLEQAIQRNEYRLARSIPPELRHYLDYSAKQAAAFHNVNFPRDFETAQVIASGA